MASIFRRKEKTHPNDLVVEFKQTGTDAGGNPVYAEVLALEPASIGGGGAASAVTIVDGGDVAQGSVADTAWVSGSGTVISLLKKIASAGGSAVSIADGADVAQGTTTDSAATNTLVGLLKAIKAAVQGTLTTSVSNFPATQPVSGAVSVSNFPATQPVSGTVAVSNFPGTQPVSGSVTADTELPAAAALSDNVANPTAPMVGGGTMLWDSTLNAGAGGWVRAPGSVAAGFKVQSGQLPAALVGGRLSVDASGVAVPVTGTFFQGTQPVSLATNTPDVTDRAARLLGVVDKGKVWDGTNIAAVKAGVIAVAADNPLVVTLHPSSAPTAAQPVTGTFFQATQPISAAALPLPAGAAVATGQSAVKAASTLAAATDTSQVVAQSPMRADAANLGITVTAATGVAATLTIPAAGAGLFHYISLIEIQLYATAARTGGATPVLVTTTNLPGSPVWDFDTAQAIGVTIRQTTQPATPIKSSAASTATTIVAPIATTGIWRITAYYYAAP